MLADMEKASIGLHLDLTNNRPGYTAALERLRLQMRAWANQWRESPSLRSGTEATT